LSVSIKSENRSKVLKIKFVDVNDNIVIVWISDRNDCPHAEPGLVDLLSGKSQEGYRY
jgi:hypothetical protein